MVPWHLFRPHFRPIISSFNASASSADEGDTSHQMNCYGMGKSQFIRNLTIASNLVNLIVYPDNCVKFHGPHSKECLKTIWSSVGCLLKGTQHPSKLSISEHSSINSLNLRYGICQSYPYESYVK